MFTSKLDNKTGNDNKHLKNIGGINFISSENTDGNEDNAAKIEELSKRVPPPTPISIKNFSKLHGEDHSTITISSDNVEEQYIPQKIHLKFSK